MSGFRAHLAFYLATQSVLSYVLYTQARIGLDIFALSVGGLYCLLPDIDSPSSKARSFANIAFVAMMSVLLSCHLLRGSLVCAYLALAVLSVYAILLLLRHRGVMHTVLAAFVLSVPLILVSPKISLYAAYGYLSHLLLDGRLLR
jgi:membrane-bound metal-dependent hydrolase YbcI (DUF457 family)